jgi:hypothetical protein
LDQYSHRGKLIVLRTRDRRTGLARRGPLVLFALAAATVALGLSVHFGVFSSSAAPEALPEQALPISLSSERLDFGVVPVHGAAMRQLVLRNDGADPIEARFEIGGPYAVRPAELILHPGISTRVEVSVRAERPGSLDDELHIRFENPNSAPLVVGLAGRAHAGAIGESAGDPPANSRPRPTQMAAFIPAEAGAAADRSNGSTRVSGPRVTDRSPVQPGGAQATSGVLVAERSRGTGQSGADDASARSERAARLERAREANVSGTSLGASRLSERPPAIPDVISPSEAARARELPSKIPGTRDGLPDRLPDEEGGDDDWDDDVFDDEDEPTPSPFDGPMLRISHVSVIAVLGSSSTFYPQELGLVGASTGGALGVQGEMVFPQVALAFGESVAFKQSGPISGSFDPASGAVTLDLPLVAIDSDGKAAPLPQFQLTTGTAVERNDQGHVVAIAGAPRNPATGVVKLVAMRQIPVGYGHFAERSLVQLEMLAEISFGTAATGLPLSRPPAGRN